MSLNTMRLNLLSQALITATPLGALTLPGVLAALARDAVADFPALRPHQGMFWHMFLVQLASLSLCRARQAEIPQDEETWRKLLRGLTVGYPDDEPWCLVVDDKGKPAFMQPAVPPTVVLGNAVSTPDAIDLLITAKNHDLKQAVARMAEPQDWLFALIALQTGEGYGGAGNQGIARMNGGSSSRPMIALGPLDTASHQQMPRLGAWFARDVRLLLETREEREDGQALDYPFTDGLGLTWLAPWEEGTQLRTKDLDRWFIEVCRRVRLSADDSGRIAASRGTSKATRTDAKHLNGELDDPWAPVHKIEGKGFTLAGRDFDYRTVIELLLSGNWALPILAEIHASDAPGSQFALVLQALARGNSKTEGFKTRFIPASERAVLAIRSGNPTLPQLAKQHVEIVATMEKALKGALALVVAGGDSEKRKKEHYAFAHQAAQALDAFADTIFFDALWRRFEAADSDMDEAVKREFVQDLRNRTLKLFDKAAPTMPCPSLLRIKAEVGARSALLRSIKHHYEDYIIDPAVEPPADAA